MKAKPALNFSKAMASNQSLHSTDAPVTVQNEKADRMS